MEIVSIVVAICGTLAAIVFSYVALTRTRKRDTTEEAKQDGILLTELGYIKSGVDDIKRKQDKQDEQYIEVVRRLTIVEESTKQSHKRLSEHIEHTK